MRLLHVMTVENLLSHQFIEDWLSFHARHVDFANRKVNNFDRGHCFANKNFHGKEGKFDEIYMVR